jgi:hypothetical protein
VAKADLLKALAVTAELTGTSLSTAAADVLADDLAVYPLEQVLGALTRCRRELKSRLTAAEIISRLDDGRPGPEEAWAMIPPDEEGSVVWTEEMAQAFGVAWALIRDGDRIGARMAFKESYTRIVTEARAKQVPPKWTPSLGRDKHGRTTVIEDARAKGRLSAPHAARLLPPPDFIHPVVRDLVESRRR